MRRTRTSVERGARGQAAATEATVRPDEDGAERRSGDRSGANDEDAFLRELAAAPAAEPPGPDPVQVAHFRVRSRLGRGGMGIVYLADDERLHRQVALKLLPEALERDGERRARFLREARAAAGITHPNVAAVYEVGEHEGRAYLAMEYVAGTTLRAVLDEGPVPVARALFLANRFAAALAEAHRHGLVHRDLKPENVMVGAGEVVKVLDFGIARREDDPVATADPLTSAGRVVGTPAYMAPEQARGEAVDRRADVFSFGVVLYEMLTGKRPFAAGNAAEALVGLLRDPAAAPSRLRREVPLWVDALVLRCLEKEPVRRFDGGAALLAALQAEGSGSARRPARSALRWLAALALAAALVVMAGLAALRARPLPAPANGNVARPEEVTASANPEALRAFQAAMKSIHDGTGLGNLDLRRAITLDPDFAAAHVMLLHSLSDCDSFRPALAGRERLGERDRAILDVYEPLCLREPPDEAEAGRRKAALVERYPDDPLILWHAGDEAPERALPLLSHAIDLDPGFVNLYDARAGLEYATGDAEAALADLRRCLELSPLASNCQGRLVEVLGASGRCASLEPEARKWMLLGTAYQGPWIALAKALVFQGRPLESAREALRQGEAKTPPPDEPMAFLQLGVDALGGDFLAAGRKADELSRAAADGGPWELPRALPLVQQLELSEELGDREAVGRLGRRFLERHAAWAMTGYPHYEPFGRVLGAMRRTGALSAAEAGRLRDDRIARWKARGFEPSDGWLLAWHLGVDAAADAGEARAAVAALASVAPSPRAGVDVDVDTATIGRAHLLAGRPDDAIPWLERATRACNLLSSPVTGVRAQLWLGQAREAKGDVKGACEAYSVVLARWGHARPRSITAEAAQGRRGALACK